ncbi:MAG: PD-(D/E)XK nuclease family protein [Alphaproteobacteria bacterium]|nr:PD-(D/E)XK nuclease family protein [Alphaproteobacteria bacterium]
MNLYTIPTGVSFLDYFVDGILENYGAEPLILSQIHIFLPSKRACHQFTPLFYQKYAEKFNKKTLFLPRLIPLGEIALDQIEISDLEFLDDFNVKPSISSLKRQFILAHLIFAWSKQQDIGLHRFDQAFTLAQSLSNFLDQLQSENIPLSKLQTLVPSLYANHWQVTLDFLMIISNHWPNILEENQKLDPIARRNHLFSALIDLYASSPPAYPVLIAGSTGTFPMTAHLMKQILALPQGHVILPGLDLDMEEDDWQHVKHHPTHPQHQLSKLCHQNQWHRDDIKIWHNTEKSTFQSAFLSSLFNPKGKYALLPPENLGFLDNLTYLNCQDHTEEANVIALILKQASMDAQKKSVLVTGDRDLVRRVKASLARWQIEVDDSHGTPLIQSQAGQFLLILLDLIQGNFEPILLLNFLKHPFIYPETSLFLEDLEQTALRGKYKLTLSDLILKMQPDYPEAVLFLEKLQKTTKELHALLFKESTDLKNLIEIHLNTAIHFADDLLWEGDAGASLSQFFKNFLNDARDLPAFDPQSYASLLRQFFDKEVYRPKQFDSKIAIWGTIEARLQNVDLVILAGLNEGSWPPEIKGDPWLNKAMRADLGLPPIERRIGLSAHDFCQAFGTQEIYLTRSERIHGSPQFPSRWLLKLENYLETLGLKHKLQTKTSWKEWAGLLDQPSVSINIKPPAPKPSFALRPRTLSATQIETLLRNPYAIFARHILKLKQLDPIQQEPSPAHFGNLVHNILEDFQKNHIGLLGNADIGKLLLLGTQKINTLKLSPDLLFFWEPSITSILKWFFEEEIKRRVFVKSSLLEHKGLIKLSLSKSDFTLKAIADRIDLFHNGQFEIIDYKTGQLPLQKDMLLGFSGQLLIEALIAVKNGFGLSINPDQLNLSLWRLKAKEDKAEIRHFKEDLDVLLPDIADNLITLLNYYDNPETPYLVHPIPEKAPIYDPYRHLSRIDEWGDRQ